MSNDNVPDSNPAAVTCPHCDAVLRNVTAEPGAGVRCLNCGKRFLLREPRAPSPAGSVPLVAPSTSAPAAPSREPPSAGYWLLRISAGLLLVAGVAVTPLCLQEVAPGFRWRWFEALLVCSYVPLIVWAGVVLLILARVLARIDAGALHVAWRGGAIQHALPSTAGSSLAYIAPLAVAGGLATMGCSAALTMVRNGAEVYGACVGLLFGAAVFCCGFAMGDLRQFCWRQRCLAQACEKAASGRNAGTAAPAWPSSVPAGCATACLAMLFVVIASREGLVPFGVSLWLAWLGYSLYRLCEDWDHAVVRWHDAADAADAKAKGASPPTGAWWEHPPGVEEQRTKTLQSEAANKEPGCVSPLLLVLTPITAILWVILARSISEDNDAFYPLPLTLRFARAVVFLAPMLLLGGTALWAMRHLTRGTFSRVRPAMRWVCIMPLVWAVYGAVWLMFFLVSLPSWSNGEEKVVLLCASGAGGALAVWLALLLAQVVSWRSAQEGYWRSQASQAEAVRLSRWHAWLIWGAVVVACVQAVVFAVWMSGEITRYSMEWRRCVELAGLPLLVVALHYPTIWVALMAREFLAVDALYESRRQAVSE